MMIGRFGVPCVWMVEKSMSTDSHDDCPSRERLSALLDGETQVAASASACAAWCEEADARRDWHAWHLIGDVMRSDELASSGDHDARFLVALRTRLNSESAVAGVVSLDRVREARRPARWRLPSAMAAGVVLVVGTLALVRSVQPVAEPSPAIASAGPAALAPPGPLAQAPVRTATNDEPGLVTDHRILRDEQLQRYLAAHKQFAGTSALGVPSAFLRSATVEAPAR